MEKIYSQIEKEALAIPLMQEIPPLHIWERSGSGERPQAAQGNIR